MWGLYSSKENPQDVGSGFVVRVHVYVCERKTEREREDVKGTIKQHKTTPYRDYFLLKDKKVKYPPAMNFKMIDKTEQHWNFPFFQSLF